MGAGDGWSRGLTEEEKLGAAHLKTFTGTGSKMLTNQTSPNLC